MDFTPITAAVSVGAIVTTIIALGAIKIAPNVAAWAANKLARFF